MIGGNASALARFGDGTQTCSRPLPHRSACGGRPASTPSPMRMYWQQPGRCSRRNCWGSFHGEAGARTLDQPPVSEEEERRLELSCAGKLDAEYRERSASSV